MVKRAPAGSGGRPPGRALKPSNKDVEILATLLVAYPQVSRVTYDPKNKALNLAFLCRGPLSAKSREAISRTYIDSVSVYLDLLSMRHSVLKCSWEKMDGFYTFLVERDVASLSPGELNLTVEFLESKAMVMYASEDQGAAENAEELNASARLFLQDTISQVKNLESTRKLVALREGERVLVFDK